MKKKRGLCMAAGGLIEDKEAAWARRRAEIDASLGLKPSKRREPEPEAAPAPTPAPAPAPQRRGGLMGAFDALTNRKRQIEAAAGYAQGGIVRGPGGPEDDEVPMQIAGKDVRLSNTEAVLPARTVQALGGPEAVEALIEQTNGKPPVKGGLRAGGRYYGGVVDDFGDRKLVESKMPPVTVNDSVTGKVVKANVRPTIAGQQDFRAAAPQPQPAPQVAQANATGPKLETPTNPNVGAGKVSPEVQALKAGQPAAPSTPAPAHAQAGGSMLKSAGSLYKGAAPVSAAISAIAGAAEPDSTKRYATRFGLSEPTGDGSAGDIAKFAGLRGLGAASDVASGATFGLADKLFRDKQQVDTGTLGGALGGAAGWKGAELLGKGVDALGTMATRGKYKGDLGQKLLGNTTAKAVAATAGGMAGAKLGADENSRLSSENLPSMSSQAAAGQTQAGEKSPVGATVVEGPQPDGQQAIDPVTKLPVGLAAAAKANDGRADFNATMDATKYNPAEGTGVITRAPGKDGLRSGTFIGGASAADAARDAKFEAAGYGKDMYGNWMTPQRIALQQAGKDWEDRNYSKQVTTEEQKAASSQQKAFAERQSDVARQMEDATKVFGRNKRASAMQAASEAQRALTAEMGMVNSAQQHAAELGLRRQQMEQGVQLAREKAASEGRPGFRDQLELAKFQYQKQHDAAKRGNLQGNNERDYRNTVIKQNNERIEKWLDTMAPTQGLKDDDLRAAQQRRAFLQEAVRSGWGGNVAIDPATFESEMPKHSQQARATMALYDALSKDSGVGAFFRNGFKDATVSQQAIVPKSYDEKRDVLVMPDGYEIPGKSVWGNDADIRAAVQARMKQAAEEGKK